MSYNESRFFKTNKCIGNIDFNFDYFFSFNNSNNYFKIRKKDVELNDK